jgi:hypothetical protein
MLYLPGVGEYSGRLSISHRVCLDLQAEIMISKRRTINCSNTITNQFMDIFGVYSSNKVANNSNTRDSDYQQ